MATWFNLLGDELQALHSQPPGILFNLNSDN